MAQCNCPFFASAARWMGTCPSHFQNKEDNHNHNANYCIQLKNIRAKFFYQRHKLRHAILYRAFSFLTLPSLWKNHIIARAGRQGPVVLSLLKENALESTFLTGFTKRKAKNKKPGKAHNNRLFEAFCLVRPTGFEPAAFRVGEPRHTTPNRDFKPFFVGCAQIGNGIQTPAKPFQNRIRGRLHARWSNGGQLVLNFRFHSCRRRSTTE